LKGLQVAVVGAGFAGLMAARTLCQYGVKVTVYEARSQWGGRVLSNPSFSNGRITEEGAELIGSFHTKWLGLAREYGLAMISRMDPDLYERAGLQLKLRLDLEPTRDLSASDIKRIGQDIDKVLEEIARDASAIKNPSQPWNETNPKIREYDKWSVARALETKYQVKRDGPLWKALRFKLVNDEVAPLDEMNFLGLLCKVRAGQSVEFSNDDPDGRACLMRYWNELEIFRCADGSQTLATEIAKDIMNNYGATIKMRRAVTGIDIRTKKCVQKRPGVDPNKPCVVLESRQVIKPDGTLDGAADSIPYHYVILAIPPSVWKERVVKGVKKGVKITVDGKPAHPADADKIGLLGMDPAVKFFVNLTERFWIKEKPPAAPYGGSLELGQVWEGTDNQTRIPPKPGDPPAKKQGIVLSVFAGPIIPLDPRNPRGPGRPPTQEECEKRLLNLYPDYKRFLNGKPKDAIKYANWPGVPFIETGYASPKLGEILTIVEKLSKPFHELLYFAGEHTRIDLFGYMEGALRSGEDAAMKIVRQSCGLKDEASRFTACPTDVRVAKVTPVRAKIVT
jgi:monoamine oxidase